MATLEQLSDRLRSEIGDTARSFVDTFTGDGSTIRYNLSNAPVQGATLKVFVNDVDVSSSAIIEEGVGLLELASAPANNAVVKVSGTGFRYFTDSEIHYYINSAFLEHSSSSTDINGSRVTQLEYLPPIEEYPLVLLASTMALYTLATDAAFDISISSPDGVSIPREQRFRQLSAVIQDRKAQYKELCALLNIGLHRIEVFNLRRISRTTNRLVPIYRPQEVDDASMPQRVRLSIPNYGDRTPQISAVSRDFSMYQGDDFSDDFTFQFDITQYTPKGQIKLYANPGYAQVGAALLGEFSFTKFSSTGGALIDSIQFTLPGSVTKKLPKTAYYDIQMTDPDGQVKTYLAGKVFTEKQITE